MVNDTIEASDLLILLGVGLLKLAQTLVYLAQNNIYVSTVVCIVFGAKISIFLIRKVQNAYFYIKARCAKD